jgi:hypothetical protein
MLMLVDEPLVLHVRGPWCSIGHFTAEFPRVEIGPDQDAEIESLLTIAYGIMR